MIFMIWCLALLCCLSGCSTGGKADTRTAENAAYHAVSGDSRREINPTVPPENTQAVRNPDDAGNIQTSEPARTGESVTAPENTGLLSSAEKINLHAVDETGRNYVFLYDNEEFSAQYTEDNWKIVDSYKINNIEDIMLICQALLDLHTVHGRDMQSVRTAEDMTFEWLQHNLAYELLPESSPWRENAKDVDLNPADQGRTFQEIYEDRTGKEFRLGDVIEQLS